MSDSRDVNLLARLEREPGVRLPAEYWSGLAADARAGQEVWLYPVPELPGINAAAELPARLPSLIIIGTEGGRELLGLDGRNDPSPVVLVDVVFSDRDDATWQAPGLVTFLRDYPRTGLRWS